MPEQLDLSNQRGWNATDRELPREFEHKPALELCWRGLVISLSEGCMSRRQAYEMLKRLDETTDEPEDGRISEAYQPRHQPDRRY